METLIIHNVDLDLLENQRQVLTYVLNNLKHSDFTTPEEDAAIEGILNMLDAWSDSRFDKDAVNKSK